MKLRSLKVLLGLSAGLVAVAASAATFTFSNEFSGTGLNCNASCATLSIDQVGADVQFTFTGTMDGDEFLGALYGNRDPYADSTPTGVSKTGFVNAVFATGEAAYKADGDGYFDWKWDLGQGADKFNDSDVLSWTFANMSIDDIIGAVSTGGNDPNKDGFTFAVHAQGLERGGSGWLYAVRTDETPVPEPGSLALLGVGLLGIAGLARRRNFSN